MQADFSKRLVWTDLVGDTAIVLPPQWQSGVVDSMEGEHFTMVQWLDIVFVSGHLPDARCAADVSRAREILVSISAALHQWKSRKRPWKCLVLGVDANCQLQSDVEGLTGKEMHKDYRSCRKLQRVS